jgi:hypothetical protein
VRKLMAIFVLSLSLAGCGVVNTLVDGLKHASAVGADLEKVTGMKPSVGANWKNGRLVSVTVHFPQLYAAKPLGELAEQVRVVVTEEFKQAPEQITLSFEMAGKAPGRIAQAGPAPMHAPN